MSPAKRDGTRPARRWLKPERSLATRRGRKHWVVRWIGAAKRRAVKPIEAETQPSAKVIYLSWADAFDRPMRIAPARLFQLAGAMIPLLPS